LQNSDGRWFSFCVKGTDLIILERKSIPQHLAALENLEMPVTIASMLNDLQDLGEAR